MLPAWVRPFAASMSTCSPRADSAAASSKTERSAPPRLVSARSITIATFRLIVGIIAQVISACKGDVPAVLSVVPCHLLCLGQDLSNELLVFVCWLFLVGIGHV